MDWVSGSAWRSAPYWRWENTSKLESWNILHILFLFFSMKNIETYWIFYLFSEYRWVSIRDIESTTGKLKRAMLQFTPGSWTSVRWLDPTCTHMRLVALCQLVIFWQVSELNTFFLKHVYEFPPSHPFVVARLVLIGVIVAPSVRWARILTFNANKIVIVCCILKILSASEFYICAKYWNFKALKLWSLQDIVLLLCIITN